MKSHNLLFIYFSFFVANIYAQTAAAWNREPSGILEKVPQFYEIINNVNTPSWGAGLAERTWYKNGMTIKIVKRLFSSAGYNKTDSAYQIYCYLFNYQPTGMMYEYRNFSDTALPLQKFTTSDSVMVSLDISHCEDGPEPNPERAIVKEEKLPDTLIENILYEVKFIHSKQATGKFRYFLTYSRCDEKMLFLKSNKLDLGLGWKQNDDCPVIKYYIVSSPEIRMPVFSQEIIFLADDLTEEEEKVFAAWERRAIKDAPNKQGLYNHQRW